MPWVSHPWRHRVRLFPPNPPQGPQATCTRAQHLHLLAPLPTRSCRPFLDCQHVRVLDPNEAPRLSVGQVETSKLARHPLP